MSNKQQQYLRLGELAKIARQRYLESGGKPHHSANGHEWLNDEEKQEYLRLARQIFDNESIVNYFRQHGTWKEKFANVKLAMRSSNLSE